MPWPVDGEFYYFRFDNIFYWILKKKDNDIKKILVLSRFCYVFAWFVICTSHCHLFFIGKSVTWNYSARSLLRVTRVRLCIFIIRLLFGVAKWALCIISSHLSLQNIWRTARKQLNCRTMDVDRRTCPPLLGCGKMFLTINHRTLNVTSPSSALPGLPLNSLFCQHLFRVK